MTHLDTNILIDIAEDDLHWANWSQDQLARAMARGPVIISPVVYAEFSAQIEDIATLDAFLEALVVEVEPIPREALFLAGRAFRRYRSQGGPRMGVLPDFMIGAHAAVRDAPLLTRDTARHRTHFPRLRLIAP